LLAWGVPREKLVRIPIAIDLDFFQPLPPERRREARARYRIPDDCLVIGSFQKDGKGWGEGNDPKLIKGPDILIDVIARVAKHRRAFVLLTGPARGYVKRGLERLGISYAHDYVENYLALPERFAALDIYVNPSRDEGGPKGVIEAMASGIPVVSTRVGMAPELIGANEAGRLVEVGDAVGLANAILEIDDDPEARSQMITRARKAVAPCHWLEVARRHYEDVYSPLIATP
jgi:glycosyltransferase involved in cell wall biosynthesis